MEEAGGVNLLEAIEKRVQHAFDRCCLKRPVAFDAALQSLALDELHD